MGFWRKNCGSHHFPISQSGPNRPSSNTIGSQLTVTTPNAKFSYGGPHLTCFEPCTIRAVNRHRNHIATAPLLRLVADFIVFQGRRRASHPQPCVILSREDSSPWQMSLSSSQDPCSQLYYYESEIVDLVVFHKLASNIVSLHILLKVPVWGFLTRFISQ